MSVGFQCESSNTATVPLQRLSQAFFPVEIMCKQHAVKDTVHSDFSNSSTIACQISRTRSATIDTCQQRYRGKTMFSSIHFRPMTDWVVGGHEERFSRVPLPIFSCGRPSWAVLAQAGMLYVKSRSAARVFKAKWVFRRWSASPHGLPMPFVVSAS